MRSSLFLLAAAVSLSGACASKKASVKPVETAGLTPPAEPTHARSDADRTSDADALAQADQANALPPLEFPVVRAGVVAA